MEAFLCQIAADFVNRKPYAHVYPTHEERLRNSGRMESQYHFLTCDPLRLMYKEERAMTVEEESVDLAMEFSRVRLHSSEAYVLSLVCTG